VGGRQRTLAPGEHHRAPGLVADSAAETIS
jgi:hypothetical protein